MSGDVATFKDRWGVVWRWDDKTETWREYTHLAQFCLLYYAQQDQYDVANDHPDHQAKKR